MKSKSTGKMISKAMLINRIAIVANCIALLIAALLIWLNC